jgi:hypothetical protein
VPKSAGVSLGLHGIGALFSAVIPVILGAVLFSKNKKCRIWLIALSLLLVFILFLSDSGGAGLRSARNYFCPDMLAKTFVVFPYSYLKFNHGNCFVILLEQYLAIQLFFCCHLNEQNQIYLYRKQPS